MLSDPKVIYVGSQNGLGNRLEMFLAAQVIKDYFGHRVWVDWTDYDLMTLPFCQKKTPSLLRRLRSYQIVKTPLDLISFKHAKTIDIRTVFPLNFGIKTAEIEAVATKIRPSENLFEELRNFLGALEGSLVVGVHVRQGDFLPSHENSYKAVANSHLRVPLWWYEHVMGLISAAVPEVTFLLTFSGDRESIRRLECNFRCVVCSSDLSFKLARRGHYSISNPVFDLYALASCPIILGTPASSFTHWAASNLGPPSVVISPAKEVYRERPAFRTSRFRYHSLSSWVNFSWYLESEMNHLVLPRDLSFHEFDLDWWTRNL